MTPEIRQDIFKQVIWHAKMATENPVLEGNRINHMLQTLAKVRKISPEDSVTEALMFFIDRYPAKNNDEDKLAVEQFIGEPARKLYAEFVYPFLPE